jgi:hypothetical protein
MPKIKLKILSQEFSQKIGLEFIQKFDIYWVGTIGAITICAIVIYAIEICAKVIYAIEICAIVINAIEIFPNPNKIPILMQIMRSAQVSDKIQFGAIALITIAQVSIA